MICDSCSDTTQHVLPNAEATKMQGKMQFSRRSYCLAVLAFWQEPRTEASFRILPIRQFACDTPCSSIFIVTSLHQDDAAVAAPLTNASRSALIWSALVVGMPCGKPL